MRLGRSALRWMRITPATQPTSLPTRGASRRPTGQPEPRQRTSLFSCSPPLQWRIRHRISVAAGAIGGTRGGHLPLPAGRTARRAGCPTRSDWLHCASGGQHCAPPPLHRAASGPGGRCGGCTAVQVGSGQRRGDCIALRAGTTPLRRDSTAPRADCTALPVGRTALQMDSSPLKAAFEGRRGRLRGRKKRSGPLGPDHISPGVAPNPLPTCRQATSVLPLSSAVSSLAAVRRRPWPLKRTPSPARRDARPWLLPDTFSRP